MSDYISAQLLELEKLLLVLVLIKFTGYRTLVSAEVFQNFLSKLFCIDWLFYLKVLSL